jgi:dihydrodiol dehydrogenase / D-xylose 1-dehydrogenase (NADP)
MNKRIINWGILGLGRICNLFMESMKLFDDSKVVAVGSRSKERADEFAKKHEIPRAYGSYEELVNDNEIDIIYVATPHNSHKEFSMLCLKAGKAVLCEKSFTVNASEAKEMIEFAQKSGLFLMEAMWTRYLPAMVKIRELLNTGILGDIRMVKADFGFRVGWEPQHRLLNPELAGGALLDVGIYTISFASMIFGAKPLKITGTAHLGETGVDEQFSSVLAYENGAIAVCTAAVRTPLTDDAWIYGTEGRIRIPAFWHANKLEIHINGKEPESLEIPYSSSGYYHEIEEAANCLRNGRIESDVMPLKETLDIIKIMDELRRQWGLIYPFEG